MDTRSCLGKFWHPNTLSLVSFAGLTLEKCQGAQWLSGRVLESRLRGRGFEPHRRHCVVVLEQDTFFNNCLLGYCHQSDVSNLSQVISVKGLTPSKIL